MNIGDILNFKSAQLKVPSLHFSKTLFTFKSLRNEFFLSEWGCGPCRARASATRLPPFIEKIQFESVFKFKVCFAKSQGIHLESGLVEVQNGSYSKKAEKFALVQL